MSTGEMFMSSTLVDCQLGLIQKPDELEILGLRKMQV